MLPMDECILFHFRPLLAAASYRTGAKWWRGAAYRLKVTTTYRRAPRRMENLAFYYSARGRFQFGDHGRQPSGTSSYQFEQR